MTISDKGNTETLSCLFGVVFPEFRSSMCAESAIGLCGAD